VDKRIRIQKSLSNEPAVIECDATLVQNALLNLGLNARDALPDGGTIRLQTEIVSLASDAPESYLDDFRPGRYVRVRVSDNGLGMDEATRQRIFEPFFTTKPSGQGTGMGLSSVYGTVKSHRGFLDVQSESRRGTTFTLYFPLAKAVLPATPLDPIIPDPVYGDGARVLVVDDEPAVCKTARTMLEELGYRVTVCSNGEEAIRYFRRHYRRVDAVLLDLVMPCMGGREALQELRRIQRNVRVVIASGYADADEELDLRKLGATGFLPKPFRRNDLADRLAEALERKDPVPVRR
jgi:CheY-like chemotaxis protein